MHTRVCRATTACCTQRSRPVLGPYTVFTHPSTINHSSTQSCKMQSFPRARSWLSPRMHPTVVVSRCHVISRRGRVASSAALSRSLSHTETAKSDLAGFGPIMSSFPPSRHAAHLSDWAYIRLILRFLPPSIQSHDLVCMPSAVVATRARITRTLLVNAMQRIISHDIPLRCPFLCKTHSWTSLQ